MSNYDAWKTRSPDDERDADWAKQTDVQDELDSAYDKIKRLEEVNAALLAPLREIVNEIRAYQSPECDDNGALGADLLKQADAAIAKAEAQS